MTSDTAGREYRPSLLSSSPSSLLSPTFRLLILGFTCKILFANMARLLLLLGLATCRVLQVAICFPTPDDAQHVIVDPPKHHVNDVFEVRDE